MNSYNDLNRKHRRALGALATRLFELFGKKVPADTVEIAPGFIALGRGTALVAKDGAANRSGGIVVTFLKALIGSAPLGDPGREPINSERSADIRCGAHNGLKSGITALSKSAKMRTWRRLRI